MDDQRRRLIAIAILGISFLIVLYLLFFSPQETRVSLITPTVSVSTATTPVT